MQKYQDLLLTIPLISANNIFKSIDTELQSSEYKRRIDIESDHLKTFGEEPFKLMIIESPEFEFEIPDEKVKGMIWLQMTERNLRIMNIVPITNTTLFPNLYNSILNDFVSKIIKPICKIYSLDFQLSEPSISIEQSIDEASLNSLKLFAITANKDTGHSHPSDFNRWCEFVCSIHKKEIKLDPELLEEWLIENQWSSEVAIRLVIDFEYSINLLSYYDNF